MKCDFDTPAELKKALNRFTKLGLKFKPADHPLKVTIPGGIAYTHVEDDAGEIYLEFIPDYDFL